ncbi:MAG: hypothetical protein AAGE94_11645 [Acidobacteriota bacterium]
MPPFDDFAQRFDRLILRVEEVDVRVPEDSALIGLAADLVPKVTRMLRDGIDLTRDIEIAYDPRSATVERPEDGDTLTHIGLMISTELAARDLNDVAYFARSELRAALERLETAATRKGGELMLASSCEAGLRCLRKALVSVESALYEFEDRDTPKRQWYDVELSLQIRKLYWNLRRETGAAAGDGDDYETRLRRVLYRVVAFRELSVYPFLRVDDRVQLRDLLKRILDWLNSDARDPDDARRVWTDLQSFAELLVQVSHRQELQDHDRDLLLRMRGRIARNESDTLPDSMLDEMQRLLGLDRELDDLIAHRIGYAAAWSEPLERLLERLDKAPEPPGRIDLLSDLD